MLQQTTRGAPAAQPSSSRVAAASGSLKQQQPGAKQQAGQQQPRRTATKGKPTERVQGRGRVNESRTAAWGGGQSPESKKEDARPGMRRASKPKQSPDAARNVKQSPDAARNVKGKPSNNNKKDAVPDAWTVVSAKPVKPPSKKGGSGGGGGSRSR